MSGWWKSIAPILDEMSIQAYYCLTLTKNLKLRTLIRNGGEQKRDMYTLFFLTRFTNWNKNISLFKSVVSKHPTNNFFRVGFIFVTKYSIPHGVDNIAIISAWNCNFIPHNSTKRSMVRLIIRVSNTKIVLEIWIQFITWRIDQIAMWLIIGVTYSCIWLLLRFKFSKCTPLFFLITCRL